MCIFGWLDFDQDVSYDDTVVEDLYKATTTKTNTGQTAMASENNQMKTAVSIDYGTSLKSEEVDVKEDYSLTHHSLSDLSYTGISTPVSQLAFEAHTHVTCCCLTE